jgi:molybdopterin molybdotransferase
MVIRSASCEDDFDTNSLSCQEALTRILSSIGKAKTIENADIKRALNRILSSSLSSPIHVPSHNNSAMDGYAFRREDANGTARTELRVVGKSLAGRPFSETVGPGEAISIMTGAVMPDTCDTVIIKEHVDVKGTKIIFDSPPKQGQHVRFAGEDLKAGQKIFEEGTRLTPAEIGLIASLGVAEIPVFRKLQVSYFSTGDELRSIGESLSLGEIYDSNRYTLYAMLQNFGAEIRDMGVVRDDPKLIKEALLKASKESDVVITSGGVSVGDADYIKEILAEIGQVGFWKVAMKPGRPLAFGKIGDSIFFGLPGNPVSVMVTFYQFVEPALRKMAGAKQIQPLEIKARAKEDLKKRPGRTEFQRGILSLGEDGHLEVASTGDQGSGILHSMSMADCFMVLPLESGSVEKGSEVTIQLLSNLT